MKPKKQTFSLKIYNGRVKIYIDGYVMLSYNQIDFKGFYAFKNDAELFGIDFYLISEDSGGSLTIETTYKTKETWLSVLKLLDENL